MIKLDDLNRKNLLCISDYYFHNYKHINTSFSKYLEHCYLQLDGNYIYIDKNDNCVTIPDVFKVLSVQERLGILKNLKEGNDQ